MGVTVNSDFWEFGNFKNFGKFSKIVPAASDAMLAWALRQIASSFEFDSYESTLDISSGVSRILGKL